jgi:hypothetical protein
VSNHNSAVPAWRARFPQHRRTFTLNIDETAYDAICTIAVRSKRTISAVADEAVNRLLDAVGAPGLCAICTNESPGQLRPLDGRDVFVCNRCESEHPREGGYDAGQVGRADADRLTNGGKRKRSDRGGNPNEGRF